MHFLSALIESPPSSSGTTRQRHGPLPPRRETRRSRAFLGVFALCNSLTYQPSSIPPHVPNYHPLCNLRSRPCPTACLTAARCSSSLASFDLPRTSNAVEWCQVNLQDSSPLKLCDVRQSANKLIKEAVVHLLSTEQSTTGGPDKHLHPHPQFLSLVLSNLVIMCRHGQGWDKHLYPSQAILVRCLVETLVFLRLTRGCPCMQAGWLQQKPQISAEGHEKCKHLI